MKVTECKLTKSNVLLGVFPDGRIWLGNAETGIIYEVQKVKRVKEITLKGKDYKEVHIDEAKCNSGH